MSSTSLMYDGTAHRIMRPPTACSRCPAPGSTRRPPRTALVEAAQEAPRGIAILDGAHGARGIGLRLDRRVRPRAQAPQLIEAAAVRDEIEPAQLRIGQVERMAIPPQLDERPL